MRPPTPPEAGACFGAIRECAAACAGQGEHRVVLLGQSMARRSAAEGGLRVDRWIRPPLGVPALAWAQVVRERASRPDRVVIWSPGLAGLARLLRPASVVITPWGQEGPPTVPAFGAGGDSTGRIEPAPAVDLSRGTLRRAWACRDDVPVVALLADPPAAGDVRAFSFVLGLTEVGAGTLHGVVSGGSSQLDRGRRFHRMSGRASPLDGVPGSLVPRLAGCDVALVLGPQEARPPLGTLRAVGAALDLGKPVVAPAWLGDHLPDARGSLLFLTDGRMRTVLPCMMRALRVAAPWRALDPDGPPRPTWRRGEAPASSQEPSLQQSPA